LKVNINLEEQQQIGLPHDAEELNKVFTRLSKVFTVAPEPPVGATTFILDSG
jgi:hypothetical protein